MSVFCNDCNKSVKYIETRKEGTLKCEEFPSKIILDSGRIMEGYLLHECNKIGASGNLLEVEAEKGRLWVGPDTDTGRKV